jgi:hypothetical protein
VQNPHALPWSQCDQSQNTQEVFQISIIPRIHVFSTTLWVKGLDFFRDPQATPVRQVRHVEFERWKHYDWPVFLLESLDRPRACETWTTLTNRDNMHNMFSKWNKNSNTQKTAINNYIYGCAIGFPIKNLTGTSTCTDRIKSANPFPKQSNVGQLVTPLLSGP